MSTLRIPVVYQPISWKEWLCARQSRISGNAEEAAATSLGLASLICTTWLGLRKGERPQQHAVDDGEHGGIHSDTQSERQHGHGGEAGIAT